MVRSTSHPLASKIKKLFLSDEDVGRLAQHTPSLAGKQCCGPCFHHLTWALNRRWHRLCC